MENKYDIFISYSRYNLKKVKEILAEIEQSTDVRCWMDLDGIESGEQFENVIISAINRCEIFLFILSEKSMNSEWTLDELDFAKKKGKRIVIVSVEDVKMSDMFYFRYHKYDQINWNSQPQRAKLLRDIRKWVGNSPKFVRTESDNTTQNRKEEQRTLFNYKIKKLLRLIIIRKIWLFILILFVGPGYFLCRFMWNRNIEPNNNVRITDSLSISHAASLQVNKNKNNTIQSIDVTQESNTRAKNMDSSNLTRIVCTDKDEKKTEKKSLSKKERFLEAQKNNDWISMKKLADEGDADACVSLAKHYLDAASTHPLAEKYAKKAQKLGLEEKGSEILVDLKETYHY